MVKNREVAEMAKNVMKKLKEKVEIIGLKLSVTENGKEGKSKMIASCGFYALNSKVMIGASDTSIKNIYPRDTIATLSLFIGHGPKST